MSEFVICIDNEGNSASLIVGKAYRTLPDIKALAHGLVRVVDEDSAEPDGYLYAESMFAEIELPEAAKRVLTTSAVAGPKDPATPSLPISPRRACPAPMPRSLPVSAPVVGRSGARMAESMAAEKPWSLMTSSNARRSAASRSCGTPGGPNRGQPMFGPISSRATSALSCGEETRSPRWGAPAVRSSSGADVEQMRQSSVRQPVGAAIATNSPCPPPGRGLRRRSIAQRDLGAALVAGDDSQLQDPAVRWRWRVAGRAAIRGRWRR